MATWDRLVVQAAEQTAHPSAVRAGGRWYYLRSLLLKSMNSPVWHVGYGENPARSTA
jgi:hypothetical protein